MDETRIRERLDDLARDAGAPDLSELGRRTIGRVRRRRVLNALTAAIVALGLAVGGYAGVRALLEVPASRIGTPDPTVSPDGGGVPGSEGFPGLWPERDAETLAETQAAVDDGHGPLRLTPEGTASMFATNLLGWIDTDVRIEGSSDLGTGYTLVTIGNRTFVDEVPPIDVTLTQLGVQGAEGIWSVVAAGSDLIAVAADNGVDPSVLHVSGEVRTSFEGAPAIEVSFLAGPTLEDATGHARAELSGLTFDLEVEVEPTPGGSSVVLVSMPDAVGASLGAVLFVLPTPIGGAEPEAAPDVSGVPPEVAVTAQRIYDAIPARDFDILASLLDPMTFVFDFGDGGDPIPEWRNDPSVLDLAIPILQLPAAAPREIEGYGTFYIWPYLIDSDFDELSERQRADLYSLGYTDRDIERMHDGVGGYTGPRLAIDATGLWRNLITGGD
jgi:hypothetical protein